MPWAGRASVRVGVVRAALVGAAVALIALALTRPAFDPQPVKVRQSGRDIVVVIDVSRSMLAQDVRPSRLDRAKLAVNDLLDVVSGDRVGIVAFAGSAVVRSPLTTDYAFARMALEQLSPDAVGRGGTAIGDGIRAATRLLFPDPAPGERRDEPAPSARFRDLILITDGEDHESKPVEAAKAAGAKGVRVIAIGLGSDLEGGLVPVEPGARDRYMEFRGERVRSKMNPSSLKAVADAAAPGSTALIAGTGNLELDAVYRRLIEGAERRELEETVAVRYREAFQILLALALGVLMIDTLVGGRRP
jgi:Ca-activated chloride channel homolog